MSVLDEQFLALPEPAALIEEMAERLSGWLLKQGREAPALVGVARGGVWVAEALAAHLSWAAPGVINPAFYRDDFAKGGLAARVGASAIPFAVEDRHLVLVDDVLMSGRTIRAALNELFDYGRPRSVTLACLIDLGGRQLPIQADVVGTTLSLGQGRRVKLLGPDPLQLIHVGESSS